MRTFCGLRQFCFFLFISTLIFTSAGYSKPVSFQIDSDVYTTLQQTILPGPKPAATINLYDIASYDAYGYGKWTFGTPLPIEKRTDIMGSGYNPANATKKSKLMSFFTISDIHVTDKESPNQGIYLSRLYKTLGISASLYSGVMLYTPHVLDAAVQTVNALHKKNPFDFGISLGDTCNSTQYNETRWYIDVLDGKVITPSSGTNLGARTI